MKKILSFLTIFLTACFLALDIFGGTLRDLLSPDVEAAYPEIIDTGERLYLTLPKTALEEDADGTYLFVLNRTERFPEEAYVASIRRITPEKEDGMLCFALGSLQENDYVVIRRYDELCEGERVHIVKEKQ